MWRWRRRSHFANLDLPSKCFISHAYQDSAARDRLISLLPKGVSAVVFPPITVEPDQFISARLIEAILGCQGLIYLRGGASAESFWVSFERDFGLRAKRQVFAYDPASLRLARDNAVPAPMPVYSCYSRLDHNRVREIMHFLSEERDIIDI